MLLNGIKVVSFCHFLQGPAADQYLADMGADVVKVEPLTGAYERQWSGANVYIEGVSGFYLCANRNKRSIAIDLKSAEGKDVARKLIAGADVVLENFRPGVFARLGFDDVELARINPTLIFASASGFGSSGPLANKPGQDLLVQARSGLISVTGNKQSGPTPVGAAIVDQHGGALLAMGILGALIRKMREGKGTRVEGSLLNAGIDLQGEPLVNWFAGGIKREALDREQNLATWFHQAPYGVYPTADGHIVVSLCETANLADAVESGALWELVDKDRYEDRDAFARALSEATARFTMAELEERFDAKNVWWAPIKYYDELLSDPQLVHSEVFREVEVRGRKIHLVNHPNRYDGKVPDLRILALEIGEHTREILAEHGYTPSDIEQLVAAKAVVASRENLLTTKGAA